MSEKVPGVKSANIFWNFYKLLGDTIFERKSYIKMMVFEEHGPVVVKIFLGHGPLIGLNRWICHVDHLDTQL